MTRGLGNGHAMQSTSWGGRRGTVVPGPQAAQSTSWSSRRPRRGAAAAVAAVIAAAMPMAAGSGLTTAAVPTQPMVIVGDNAGELVRDVGAREVRSVTDAAVADLTAAQVARLTRQGLRVAANGPVTLTADDDSTTGVKAAGSSTRRISVATEVGASHAHNGGAGITIAVIDSGVDEVPALAGRVHQGVDFTGEGAADRFGHGTFIAGLAAGNGAATDGTDTGIRGVAPRASVISVKVADARGASTVGQVVLGLAWTLEHQARLGIDVVNLALTTGVETSYHVNPINALVEAAWFSGMTVVASAGNQGQRVAAAPGNDPWVLTVGSVHDNNTPSRKDDTLSVFSNTGPTLDGFAKPEVTAAGQHVQGPLPVGSTLAGQQKDLGLPVGYGQLSGTSMAAGVVAGSAAAILGERSGWSNDMVKSALTETRERRLGAIRLDHALRYRGTASVNDGLRPSIALAAAYAQLVIGTTDYSTVDFGSVDWRGVAWASATWTDATWTDATWSDATWTSATWTSATWTSATWTSATWSDATWTSATWSDTVAE